MDKYIKDLEQQKNLLNVSIISTQEEVKRLLDEIKYLEKGEVELSEQMRSIDRMISAIKKEFGSR